MVAVLNVNSSSADIRGNQHIDFTLSEFSQRFLTFLLVTIAVRKMRNLMNFLLVKISKPVDGARLYVTFTQIQSQTVSITSCFDEHQSAHYLRVGSWMEMLINVL